MNRLLSQLDTLLVRAIGERRDTDAHAYGTLIDAVEAGDRRRACGIVFRHGLPDAIGHAVIAACG
jgi:hypothetical protein